MSGFVPMGAMQSVDLAIAAAEDMEAKLSLVDKQPARGGRFGGRSGPYNPRGAYTAAAHNNRGG